MTDVVTERRSLGFARQFWRAAILNRSLALWSAGLVVVETAWFGFAGYELRKFPLPQVGSLSPSAAFQTSSAMPPFYVQELSQLLVLVIPAFVAVLFVAPLFGSACSTKSVRLFWTQSISRSLWFWSRLIPAFIAAGLVSFVGEAETSRWLFPHLDTFQRAYWPFPFSGLSEVGMSFALVAVAALAAILLRRSTLAIVVSLAAYGACVVFVSLVYPRVLQPVTVRSNPYNGPGSVELATSANSAPVVVSSTAIGPGGLALSNAEVNKVYSQCSQPGIKTSQSSSDSCLKQHGLDYYLYEIQPGSRLPELQLLSFAILAVGAGVIAGSTRWLVVRIEV